LLAHPPSKLWLVLILGGLVLRLSDVLDPVHEQMHAETVAITGGEVVERVSNFIQWRGGNTPAVLFFGYHGELWLYGLAALLFKRIGLGCYGALLVVGPRAVGSIDFNQLRPDALLLHLAVWLAVVCVLAWLTYRRYAEVDQDGPQQLQPITLPPRRL